MNYFDVPDLIVLPAFCYIVMLVFGPIVSLAFGSIVLFTFIPVFASFL